MDICPDDGCFLFRSMAAGLGAAWAALVLRDRRRPRILLPFWAAELCVLAWAWATVWLGLARAGAAGQ